MYAHFIDRPILLGKFFISPDETLNTFVEIMRNYIDLYIPSKLSKKTANLGGTTKRLEKLCGNRELSIEKQGPT